MLFNIILIIICLIIISFNVYIYYKNKENIITGKIINVTNKKNIMTDASNYKFIDVSYNDAVEENIKYYYIFKKPKKGKNVKFIKNNETQEVKLIKDYYENIFVAGFIFIITIFSFF